MTEIARGESAGRERIRRRMEDSRTGTGIGCKILYLITGTFI
jgi:hypothetical protein